MTSESHSHHKIEMQFDGLCEPVNPGGVATYGLVVRVNGTKVFEANGLADAVPWTSFASNNVAEYSGLIRGLEWLRNEGHARDEVTILGDSKLIVNQLNGKFKIKAVRLVELHRRARELMAEFPKAKLVWVERASNSEADLLSRVAYAKYVREHPRTRSSS